MEKKTISELYQECKEKAEQKLEPTVEVQKGYLFGAWVASIKLSPIPIPPIPQSLQVCEVGFCSRACSA